MVDTIRSLVTCCGSSIEESSFSPDRIVSPLGPSSRAAQVDLTKLLPQYHNMYVCTIP